MLPGQGQLRILFGFFKLVSHTIPGAMMDVAAKVRLRWFYKCSCPIAHSVFHIIVCLSNHSTSSVLTFFGIVPQPHDSRPVDRAKGIFW